MAVQRLSWRLPCAACLFHDLEKIRFLARATLLCGVWEWVLVSRHAFVVRSEDAADCEIVARSTKSTWYLLTSSTSLIWRLVGSRSLAAKWELSEHVLLVSRGGGGSSSMPAGSLEREADGCCGKPVAPSWHFGQVGDS